MRTTNTLIVILGFLLIFYSSINGQKPYTLDNSTTFIDNAMMECFYDYTVKAHPRKASASSQQKDSINKTVAITYNTLLQANATVSKFWDWHTFKVDSVLFTVDDPTSNDTKYMIYTNYVRTVKYQYVPVVFKNYPQGKISVIDDIAPDMYLYEEPKTGLIWRLDEDTMTVCGYLCNKAVASYGGREWTAWYAPEIAISDGPWKLYGLPGLILKAVDATDEHSFDAVVIRNTERPIYLTKDFERLKIKKEKFLKQKLEFDKDPFINLKLNPAVKEMSLMNESNVYINWKQSSIISDLVHSPLELK